MKILLAFMTLTVSCFADDKPANGPPWSADFWKAQVVAIKTGRPMVVVCRVPPKEGAPPSKPSPVEAALADASLATAYDEAVWVELSLSDSAREDARAVERVALRLGWKRAAVYVTDAVMLLSPGSVSIQLIIPENLQRSPASLYVPVAEQRDGVDMTGESIAKAIRAANAGIKPSINLTVANEARAADLRAAKLENPAKPEVAVRGLADKDWVVRYRAFQFLKENSPDSLVKHLPTLLAFNDGTPPKNRQRNLRAGLDSGVRVRARFENENFLDDLVNWLGIFDAVEVTSALNTWIDPKRMDCLNNPMRCRLANSLGKRGDLQSLKILEPWATSGDSLNLLTKEAVSAVAGIVERHPALKPNVIAILKKAFPQAPKNDAQYERNLSFCLELAVSIHQHLQTLTGRKVDFPERYDAESRRQLLSSWGT